ncbi:MAG TPA: erythromycin esterase family protein [Patescibacteria group bacterium]|nr:erythromycin esterase family protein [Patescibacteria group bacterium]
MAVTANQEMIEELQETIHPLAGERHQYEPLLERIGDAKYVLLGEATHGTHEFYDARAEISKRLIQSKGFNLITWEADWPDALRVNRYIQGRGDDRTALDAMSDFKRFPAWMWRNKDVLSFVQWLREWNERHTAGTAQVGLYGLDLYSLHTSMEAVIDYLQKQDPEAAEAARRRYACFEEFGDDPQSYGMTAAVDRSLSCEREVVQQLVELQRNAGSFLQRDGRLASDELFFATQNAVVAKGAEEYYRAMYRGRPNTWNLRDRHMVETLDRLVEHLEKQGEKPKIIVSAHNSHLGDARATSMTLRGEWNVGQLLREWHNGETSLVGFTTFRGTVTAASEWGGPAERKVVRPGMQGSYEQFFHQVEKPRFLLDLRNAMNTGALPQELLERAIGVIYLPLTERWSHYFFARIASQFDAVLHFDHTEAVEPLEPGSEWQRGELPETFPSGI